MTRELKNRFQAAANFQVACYRLGVRANSDEIAESLANVPDFVGYEMHKIIRWWFKYKSKIEAAGIKYMDRHECYDEEAIND